MGENGGHAYRIEITNKVWTPIINQIIEKNGFLENKIIIVSVGRAHLLYNVEKNGRQPPLQNFLNDPYILTISDDGTIIDGVGNITASSVILAVDESFQEDKPIKRFNKLKNIDYIHFPEHFDNIDLNTIEHRVVDPYEGKINEEDGDIGGKKTKKTKKRKTKKRKTKKRKTKKRN